MVTRAKAMIAQADAGRGPIEAKVVADHLRGCIAILECELAEAKVALKRMQADLDRLSRELAEARRELRGARGALDNTEQARVAVEARLAAVAKVRNEMRAELEAVPSRASLLGMMTRWVNLLGEAAAVSRAEAMRSAPAEPRYDGPYDPYDTNAHGVPDAFNRSAPAEPKDSTGADVNWDRGLL